MIHIKKYIMAAAAGEMLVSAIIGCTKTEDIYIADLYQKAYITTDIYPQTEGQYMLTTTNTSPSLEISDSRLVKTEGGEVDIYSGIKSYKVYFRTSYAVKEDLSGTLAVPSNAEELVEAYNATNGYTSDEAFQLLPAEYYAVTNGNSTIPSGRKEGEEPFIVEFADEFKGLDLGNYIIPLVCTLEKGTDVELSENMNTVYLKFSYSYKDETVDARNERILYNNVDFTYTASGFYGYAPWTAAALFNDTVDDVAFSSSQGSNVTVTFNEPVYLSRIGFAMYDQNSYGSTKYYWVSWTYESGNEDNVGSYYLSTPTYSSPAIYWFDISGEYLDNGQKIQDIYFQLYYTGYNFSEVYLVAFDE